MRNWQCATTIFGLLFHAFADISHNELARKIKRSQGAIKEPAPRARRRGIPAHHALAEFLLDGGRYNPSVRPVNAFNISVAQRMRMNLYQILDVNEPHQQIMLYAWTTQYWYDYMLGWDPAEFEGMTKIIIPYDKVWIPDTVLYNCVEMTRANSERWISVIYTTDVEYLNRTGETRAAATFQYPAIYKFACKMDIFLFPFDDQNCTMTFGSWVYDASGIEMTPFRDKVTFEDYVENEEWRVLDFHWVKNVIKYSCCPHPYTLLEVHLVIQRKSLYYVANLVLPTGIITFIAVVGFFTPASTNGERTEKVNLGITTLLAMSILLLMVNENMPTTSNFIPLMGWFFLLIIAMISVGATTTAVIIVIHQQHIYGRRVPRWLKRLFFDFVAPVVLCKPSLELELKMKEDKQLRQERKVHKIQKLKLSSLDTEEDDCLEPNGHPPSPHRFHKNWSHLKESRNKRFEFDEMANEAPEQSGMALSLLVDIQASLDEVTERLVAAEKGTGADIVELEWAYLATILDRIFLIIFIALCSTLTMGMIFLPTFFGKRKEAA